MKKAELQQFIRSGGFAWPGTYRVQSIGDFVETMENRGVRFV